MLQEVSTIYDLRIVLSVYDQELEVKGYSALTRASYISAINRFFDFLDAGEVVPEFRSRQKELY